MPTGGRVKSIMSDNNLVIGVDIGGTKIAVSLLDEKKNILCESIELTPKTNLFEPNRDSEIILGFVISLIEKIFSVSKVNPSDVGGIGIGVAGTVDFEEGKVIFSPNLPFREFDFKEAIRTHFKVPVFLDNDANVAAWGEKCYGAGRDASEIVCVTIGTGIGGGLILNDEVYRGSIGCASEIGHMVIDINGPKCSCGNYGCFEAMAAGPAIARKAREAVFGSPDTLILKIAGGEMDNVNGEVLMSAAAEGDELAIGVLQEVGEIVGVAFANLVNIFNPELIIVGGGVAESGGLVLEHAEKIVKERAIKPNSEIVKIVKAKLGNKAGVIGAAALIEKEIKKRCG
ncbi:MAG TPA: ROK family glucokinase [Actinobacteria bacterium]|nr:ROK family glucokinase [Actinomycetota bacterium]